MRDREITAICDVCRREVENDEGSLWVNEWDIGDRRAAVKKWAEDHPGNSHSMAEIQETPSRIRWRLTHDKCEGAVGYSRDVSEVRTFRALTAVTAGLLKKTWLEHTDWRILLEGATHPGTTSRLVAASLR